MDSQPIIDVSSFHRYAIGQYVDVSGDVISHLNISHVRADDGGLYTCVALNSMGSVEHAARLNVYGKWNTIYFHLEIYFSGIVDSKTIKIIALHIIYIDCPMRYCYKCYSPHNKLELTCQL